MIPPGIKSGSVVDSPPRIPITRLDNSDHELMPQLLAAVERIAHSAAFTLGSEVEAFEQEYARYCGTAYAIGVSSGTAALELALRALGIGPDDEVLVPANSFIATAEAVSLVGAIPVLIDVNPRTALIDAELVAEAIGPRTRCVIPVHLYGRTVDLDPIIAVAQEHGIAVLEDACQAHGALIDERRAGAVGDAGCFSFYPSKNLGAWGDAGAVVTNNPAIGEAVRKLRSHGQSTRHRHELIGNTARLDALQAAILRIKLPRLEARNAVRRSLAATLSRALDGTAVTTPAAVRADGDHVFHQFVVEAEDRDGLRAHLAAHGIDTAVHYPVPIHRTPAYAWAGLAPGSLPVSEALSRRICSLPMFPSLSGQEIARIVSAIAAF